MKRRIRLVALSAIALLSIAPLLFLVSGTLMGNQEIFTCIAPGLGKAEGYASWHLLAAYPTLRNVVALFLDSPEFFSMFWNSVKISVGIVGGQILFGMPAAWGLACYSFRGRKALYLLCIVLMMMPFQVTMLSEYLVLDRLHLLDTLAAVILPGMFSTFSVFVMYRFFRSIPKGILEAARIDGASDWQIFFHIGVPMGSSGILSAVILSFLECWSMLEQPLTFLQSKNLWPLSLFLPEIQSNNAGVSLCASLVALVPAVLIFLSGQDYLEQGIAASAMKE
ncbi:MAG: carbohydrate ABC transporter permease [Eubacteriales bacterium]|nr:carbohydrate ABC transporter permease [Eubacteriales bacterium]